MEVKEVKPTTTKRYYTLDLDRVFKLLKKEFKLKGEGFEEIELEGADYIKVNTNNEEFSFATYEGEINYEK